MSWRRRALSFHVPLSLTLILFSVVVMTFWWEVLFGRVLDELEKGRRANLILTYKAGYVSQGLNYLKFLENEEKLVRISSCEERPCIEIREGIWQLHPGVISAIREANFHSRHILLWENGFLILVLILNSLYLMWVVGRERRSRIEREEFIAMATHELKHPIAGISLILQTIRNGALPDGEQNRYLDKGLSEISRLNRQIESLMKTQDLDSYRRDQSVHYKAGEFLNLLIHGIGSPERISFNNQSPGLLIRANQGALSLILTNLIENALLYSEDFVEITLRSTRRKMVISVHDSGLGFTSTEKKGLGQMFFRSSRHPVQNRKGTGLGLFTVYRLARLKKWTVRMHSPGENLGSTFELEVPL